MATGRVMNLKAEDLRGTCANGAGVTSWTDGLGNTGAEATSPPTFVSAGTPNGKASLASTTAGNKRLDFTVATAMNNVFAIGGYYVEVFKQHSTGGGGFGQHWSKGSDRLGYATSSNSLVLDFSTTDPGYALPAYATDVWTAASISVSAAAPANARVRQGTAEDIVRAASPTGSGSYVDNSASPFTFMNNAARTRAFDGEIAWQAFYNLTPSLIERELIWWRMRREMGIAA